MGTILLVDDNKLERHLLINLLKRRIDYDILEAENGREALDILSSEKTKKIKAVILDLQMPVMGGMETLLYIKNKTPSLPVIILTGTKNTSEINKAIQMGACDFISKPFQEDRLMISIHNAIKMSVLSKELSTYQRDSHGKFSFENIIGFDGGLINEVKIARKIANSDLPVLIDGETGTGKELFAKAIHGESHRAGKPFISVNCGAIPAQLVESTLFGHEKGAFTGATQKYAGRFREAQNGTIFLDEIGDLPIESQVKLLRVLQQKEVEPVGGSKPIPINVRIISATNRDLESEVKAGRFREDLLFRLNVLKISLPSLKQRKDDIEYLVDFFVTKFCTENNIAIKTIDKSALNYLKNFSWPGNVRQLENIIYKSITLAEDKFLKLEDFDKIIQEQNSDLKQIDFNQTHVINCTHESGAFKTLEQIESEAIHFALKACNGNITKAAKVLGVAKSTFYKKIKNM